MPIKNSSPMDYLFRVEVEPLKTKYEKEII